MEAVATVPAPVYSRKRVGGLTILTREKAPWERTLFFGKATVLSPEGDVLYEDPDWMPNTLADQGEVEMGQVYLKGVATSSKYLGLLNDGTIAETDTPDLLTETTTAGTNGYARQQLVAATWPAFAVTGGDGKSTYPEITFGPATATWTVTSVWITDHVTNKTSSNLFIAWVNLGATTTVNSGQSFKYTLTWTNT